MSEPLTEKTETNIDRFLSGFQTGVFFDEINGYDFRIAIIPPKNIFSLDLRQKRVSKSQGPSGCIDNGCGTCSYCIPSKKGPSFMVKIKWYDDSDRKSEKSEEFRLFTDLNSESFNKKFYDALNRVKSDENIIEKMSQKILELENIIYFAPETGKGFKLAKENFNELNRSSCQASQPSIPK